MGLYRQIGADYGRASPAPRRGAHARSASPLSCAISSSNGTSLSVDLRLARARSRRRCSRSRSPRPRPCAGGRRGTSAPPRPASRSSAPSPRCAPAAARAWPAGCWLRTSSADHQAEAHAALGLRLEHVGRDRRLVGVLHAALLQVGARRLDHALDLAVDQRLRHVELGGLDQRVHHARLVARQHAELHLALEVLADVGAQRPRPCRRRCRATWRTPR